jgi:hypothetical protein
VISMQKVYMKFTQKSSHEYTHHSDN